MRRYFNKIIGLVVIVIFISTSLEAYQSKGAENALLSPPLFLSSPCEVVQNGDGTYSVVARNHKNPGIEFLWFLIGEAVDKGLREDDLKALIRETLGENYDLSISDVFDIENITAEKGSFILPLKRGMKAIRFFDEKHLDRFKNGKIENERLILSSGKVIRYGAIDRKPSTPGEMDKNDNNELEELITIVDNLWKRNKALWSNLYDLGRKLRDEHGLHLIKIAGRKLLMYSKNRSYVLKVNLEEDFAYNKEKAFFERGISSVETPKMLYHNDASKTLIFNNITIDSDNILFYEYLHRYIEAEGPIAAAKMMRSYARALADIHLEPLKGNGKKRKGGIFLNQDKKAQFERLRSRYHYMIKHGYGVYLPGLNVFKDAQDRIEADDIVVTHGDPSPWNIYVDVVENSVAFVFDAETSSEESRYKDLAKVIISFIDASKNGPHMIHNLKIMLDEFFAEYFRITGIDGGKTFRSLPYYLATQLLWYTEGTQRTFSNYDWVRWRLELCLWSLSKEEFNIDSLIEFLSDYKNNIQHVRIGDPFILNNMGEIASSGQAITVAAGESFQIHLELKFPEMILRAISAMQVGVELWTDLDQKGAWYGLPVLELQNIRGDTAVLTGHISANVPGKYGITARIVPNNGKDDIWSDIEFGNVNIVVRDRFPSVEVDNVWRIAHNSEFHGVMLDYDGTVKDYEGTVPDKIYDLVCGLLKKGIPVSINTSRSTPDTAIEFFKILKARLGSEFHEELCYIYYGEGYFNLAERVTERIFDFDDIGKTMKKVFESMTGMGLDRYIADMALVKNDTMIGLRFRGNTGIDVFTRVLNRKLEEINKTLPEEVVALHSDNLYQIIPKRMTKLYWIKHFSEKTGIPVSEIARVGDQGQHYGVDNPMLDSFGGFTVNHKTNTYIYPLSVPARAGVHGTGGTIWLLENLKLTPYYKSAAVYDSTKPKALILYADRVVDDMAFFDMAEALSSGFLKEENVFEGGSIVLYGSNENCEMLRKLIASADPSINLFTIETYGLVPEHIVPELVSKKAKMIVTAHSGIEHDFIGLIKGKTDKILSMAKAAKDIDMPIVLFKGEENAVFSFYGAVMEAFNRKYGLVNKGALAILTPSTRLSEDKAVEIRQHLLEQKKIATMA